MPTPTPDPNAREESPAPEPTPNPSETPDPNARTEAPTPQVNRGGGTPVLLSAQSESYSYNAIGLLTGISADNYTATYTYNPDGLRHSKVVNTETRVHIWDGMNIVGETVGADTTWYVRGHNLLWSKSSAGITSYFYNGHNDVVATTGANAKDYLYDAFGNQVDETTNQPFDWRVDEPPVAEADYNPFRYCGEYFDYETGYIYLRARYYDSTNGRFISEDQVRDGINWYVYCASNPVKFADSMGMKFNDPNIDPNNPKGYTDTGGYGSPGPGTSGSGGNGGGSSNGSGSGNGNQGSSNQGTAPTEPASLPPIVKGKKNVYEYTDAGGYGYAGDGTAPIRPPAAPVPNIMPNLPADPRPDLFDDLLNSPFVLYKRHTSNARPSTEEKHQAGEKRKQTDQPGGEKGDERRKQDRSGKRRRYTQNITLPITFGENVLSISPIAVGKGIILGGAVVGGFGLIFGGGGGFARHRLNW